MLVNGYAILWSTLVLFFSFWPRNMPVTPVNMNWSVLLWGTINTFAAAFWVVHGRKVYKGPIVETCVPMNIEGRVAANQV